MKLSYQQKFTLKDLLKQLTDKDKDNDKDKEYALNDLKDIVTDILSEDDKKQAEAFAKLQKILEFQKNSHPTNVNVSVHATFLLGYCYYHGIGIRKDTNQTVALLKTIQDKSSFAQSMMGLYALSIPKEKKQAFELFQLATSQGNANAQFNLGMVYERGLDVVAKDEKRAREFYQLAVDQGHPDAQYNLGVMYDRGQGVTKDEKRAFELYQLAADQGHADAQYNLGCMYALGEGITKDEKQACECYHLAADQEHVQAQYTLGVMYERGRGVTKDEKRAFEFYQLAAKQGHADAQYNLGLMYAKGQVVAKDVKKASEMFRLLANQGNTRAQLNTWLRSLELTPLGDKQFNEIINQLKSKTVIPYVKLNWHVITVSQVQLIAQALENNQSVEVLDLSCNTIQIEGVIALANALKNNKFLKGIFLGGCSIGDEGALALGQMLKDNTTLQCLALWGNKITFKGITALIKGLENPNTSLQCLWLVGNAVNIATLNSLAPVLDKNIMLKSLSIGSFNNDLAFGALAKEAPSPVSLNSIVPFINSIVPFIDLWTDSDLAKLSNNIHIALLRNNEILTLTLKHVLVHFFMMECEPEGDEVRYLKRCQAHYHAALKEVQKVWHFTEKERTKFYVSLVNKVMACVQPLSPARGIEFLSNLSNIDQPFFAAAQYKLGVLYEQHISEPKHLELAIEWYQKAARQEAKKVKAAERIACINKVISLKKEMDSLLIKLEALGKIDKKSMIDRGRKEYCEQCRAIYHDIVSRFEEFHALKVSQDFLQVFHQRLEQSISLCVEATDNVDNSQHSEWKFELLSLLTKEPMLKDSRLPVIFSIKLTELAFNHVLEKLEHCTEEEVLKQVGEAAKFYQNHYHFAQKYLEELRVLGYFATDLKKLQEHFSRIEIIALLRLSNLFPKQGIELLKPWAEMHKADKPWAEIHFILASLYDREFSQSPNHLDAASAWYQQALMHQHPGAQQALHALNARAERNRSERSNVNIGHMLASALSPLQEAARLQAEAAKKQAEALAQQTQATIGQTDAIQAQTLAIADQTRAMREQIEAFKKNQAALLQLSQAISLEYKSKSDAFAREWKENREFLDKNLSPTIDPLQQHLEELQARVLKLEDSFSKNPVDEKQLLELQQTQNVLLQYYQGEQDRRKKEEGFAKERKALQEELQKYPVVYRFYRVFRLRLHAFFHGYQSLASEVVKREKFTTKDKASQAIQGLGGMVPIPYSRQIASLVSSPITRSADKDVKSMAEKVTELAISCEKLEGIILETARGLVERYWDQLHCLTEKGAALLAQTALKYIELYISQSKEDELSKLTDEQLVTKIIDAVSMLKLILKQNLKKMRVETTKESRRIEWTYEGVLQRTGIKIPKNGNCDEFEYFSPPKSRPDKYGFRLGRKETLPKDSQAATLLLSPKTNGSPLLLLSFNAVRRIAACPPHQEINAQNGNGLKR